MISQTAEYALRAVVSLAQHPDKPLTATEIAKFTKVPEHYLSKVLKELARGEIVHSKRGLHGGFILAHAVEELALLDVIDVVDPIKKIDSCPLKLASHGTNLCPLHKRINDSIAHMRDTFREATVSTILAEPTLSTPLCESWQK